MIKPTPKQIVRDVKAHQKSHYGSLVWLSDCYAMFGSHVTSVYGIQDQRPDFDTWKMAAKLQKRYNRYVNYLQEVLPQWKVIDTTNWMDNSVEVTEQALDGRTRRRMTTSPHGDVCY